jgi:hypothetical protein
LLSTTWSKMKKMKKYSINFKIKDYSNRNHAEIEKIFKRRDLKIEVWHYLIIYQIFQLHDEKRKREDLRRFFFDVSTIKINEILSDICVVQSKTRDKFIIKFIIKFKKTAKESIRFVTFMQYRSKRRNSKKEQNQQKRFKRSEVFNINEKVINLRTNEFDVKSRKTRSQTRKKIIEKIETTISIKEFKTSKKTYIMSEILQLESHHHTSIFSNFVKNTSDFENKFIVFSIAKSKNSRQKEDDIVIMTFNFLTNWFFMINDVVIKLRKTEKIDKFLKEWNRIVFEVNEILKNIDYN